MPPTRNAEHREAPPYTYVGRGDLIESSADWKKLRFGGDGRVLALRRSRKSRRFGGGGDLVLLSNYRLISGELRRIYLNTVDPEAVAIRMAMLVAADIAAGILAPDSKVALIYRGAEVITLSRTGKDVAM